MYLLVAMCVCFVGSFAQPNGIQKKVDRSEEFKNAVRITIDQLAAYRGKTVKICDRVTEVKLPNISKDRGSELYVGGHFPDQKFTIFIPKSVREKFSYNPEEKMVNKRFCIVGKLTRHKGKPAIVVKNENQINEEE